MSKWYVVYEKSTLWFQNVQFHDRSKWNMWCNKRHKLKGHSWFCKSTSDPLKRLLNKLLEHAQDSNKINITLSTYTCKHKYKAVGWVAQVSFSCSSFSFSFSGSGSFSGSWSCSWPVVPLSKLGSGFSEVDETVFGMRHAQNNQGNR